MRRAPRLAPGARVAVVAPSGPVPEDLLQAGLDILRGWGLEVTVAPHVLAGHREFGYLAGSDADRAADLQNAWCDPAVDAVFCARGGYGAQRMVDLVDWAAVRAAGPKVFLGYSDITALHEAFAVRAGVATLHGPMVAVRDFIKTPATQEHLRATLFEPESVLTHEAGRALIPGRARGVVLGGCLSLLSSDLGTPHARPSAGGGLLCIEDVDEEDYRLDRCLTQLLRSGWLEGVRGVLLGSWVDCGPYRDVRAVLRDRLSDLGVPVAEEFGFGHADAPRTLPFGLPATLTTDANRSTLRYEVPALR
ncbi:LD-carboxypeptidase [Streptomyces triticagri]|uniref:LD-carboxypeptidase n=1 Tax=Streptomyces triticagri TaxID=2293568 RepID=A0A372M4I4_9ACTN|nr:LD-carboxypeptidase [Streptomyces triticagri]